MFVDCCNETEALLNSAFFVVMFLLSASIETLPKRAEGTGTPSTFLPTTHSAAHSSLMWSSTFTKALLVSVTNGLPTSNPIQKLQSLLDL